MEVETYQCAVCNATFQTNKALIMHRYRHGHSLRNTNTVICTICNGRFKNAGSLRKHRSTRHRTNVRPYHRLGREQETESSPFVLAVPVSSSSSTTQAVTPLVVATPSTSQPMPVICTICNKRFKTVSTLHNHRSIYHRANVRPYHRHERVTTPAVIPPEATLPAVIPSTITTPAITSTIAVIPSTITTPSNSTIAAAVPSTSRQPTTPVVPSVAGPCLFTLPRQLLTVADLPPKKKRKNYRYMREFLNLEFVVSHDGNSMANDDVLQRDFVQYFQQNRFNFNLAFHAMVKRTNDLDTIEKRMPSIDRILPFRCLCFCNLIPSKKINSLQDAQIAFSEISRDLDNWHHHCIIIMKNNVLCSERTLEYEFARMIAGQRHLKKMRSLDHLLHVVLYISGRQSSKWVNAHMYHALGYYIGKEQKTYLKSVLKDMHKRAT